MRRALTRIVGGVLCLWLAAEAAAADTAQISGTVTYGSTTGAPADGAEVLVEIVAKLPTEVSGFQGPGYIPLGPRLRVRTTNAGAYAATLPIPTGIPKQHLHARLLAVKPQPVGGQVYDARELLVALTGAGAVQTYQQQLVLPPAGFDSLTGTCVTGTVRDQQTGERLRGFRVVAWTDARTASGQLIRTNSYFTTDADGTYMGVVRGMTPQTTPPVVPNVTLRVGAVAYGNRAHTYGVTYVGLTKRVSLVSGKLQVVDLELLRLATQTAIVGRVTRAWIGTPVPNALVTVKINRGIGSFFASAITDAFGRYQLVVDFHFLDDAWSPESQPPVSSIVLRTNGAFLAYTDSTAPFQAQQEELIGRVVEGATYQHDFALAPRQ